MKPYEEISFPNGYLRWIREGDEYVCRMSEGYMRKMKLLHEALALIPVPEKQEPVAKCAQCKKEYRHGKTGVGCPKCAPNLDVSELEFRKPIVASPQRQPLTVGEIIHAAVDAGYQHMKVVDLINITRAMEAAHGIKGEV